MAKLVSREVYEYDGDVVDLSIEDNHNFFVGKEGQVLAHNCGDDPTRGPGQASLVDFVLIGEGEMLDLKMFQQLIKAKEKGVPKAQIPDLFTNENHPGVYDPTRILFEYADKTHVFSSPEGQREVIFPGGGHIERISLIDPSTNKLFELAGPLSEDLKGVEAAARAFHEQFSKVSDGSQVGRKYIKIAEAP